ncbi:MAG TPA: hypothetical protein VH475_19170, partial [Tepidisphaeraceae bacterium]
MRATRFSLTAANGGLNHWRSDIPLLAVVLLTLLGLSLANFPTAEVPPATAQASQSWVGTITLTDTFNLVDHVEQVLHVAIADMTQTMTSQVVYTVGVSAKTAKVDSTFHEHLVQVIPLSPGGSCLSPDRRVDTNTRDAAVNFFIPNPSISINEIGQGSYSITASRSQVPITYHVAGPSTIELYSGGSLCRSDSSIVEFNSPGGAASIGGETLVPTFDIVNRLVQSSDPDRILYTNTATTHYALNSFWTPNAGTITRTIDIDLRRVSCLPPTISGFDPSSGLIVGQQVTINGSTFTFGPAPQAPPTVKFNTTTVGSADLLTVEANKIVAKVPQGATTGKISVTTPCGTATSSSDFTVSSPQPPDLSVGKTHSGTFTPGTNVTYTITVTNSGLGPTTGAITVTDTLPPGLSFVASPPAPSYGTGWSCLAAGQVVTCVYAATNPHLGAGALSTVVVTAAVSATAGSNPINRVTVATPGDSNGDNDGNSDPPETPCSSPLGQTGGASAISGVTASDPQSCPLPHIDYFEPAFGPPGTAVRINGSGFPSSPQPTLEVR